ncbi:MAG TPA: zinc-ribbon domain-containing protein [Ktedonobacteraceae bacterium]
MYCVHCGAENPTDATFCQKCGKRLPTTDQDEATVSSIPSAFSTPYENTPYTNTPSTSSDTVFALPPPSRVPSSGEKASSSGLPSAQQPKRRRGYIISLVLIVLLVIAAAGAYVYLNRSTPDKTITTYYAALVHGDYQTAYDQLSTAAKGNLTEPRFAQIWQGLGGVKAWSLISSQEQSSTATAKLSLTLGNGQITPASISLIDENGVWKIENETIG